MNNPFKDYDNWLVAPMEREAEATERALLYHEKHCDQTEHPFEECDGPPDPADYDPDREQGYD